MTTQITPDEVLAASGDTVPTRVAPNVELGISGLRRTAGYVQDEFLVQLQGRKAVQIYREMADNDPIIGALLFAVDRLLREVTWRVEAPSDDAGGREAAEFLESCMNDMSHTWDDFISEVLTMLPYGWAYHEIVYKKRIGPWEKDGSKRSNHTDGKIGWRKMPLRAQETLLRWVFDEKGGIEALVQLAPPLYQTTVIPIDKSLLFRLNAVKNNPEGRSFLRNAYRPWYMKKRLEEIEGIGVERDLAGLPVAKVPAHMLKAAPGTADAKMVDAFRKMVRSVRRDEQEGVILPAEYDPDTKQPMYDFQLMTSGGGRQFDTNEIIERYEQRMLMSVLADFILVGHEGTGSYAMHTDKSGLFRTSINSISRAIADVLNRYAVPRLFQINGWKLDELPKIVPNDVDPPDLTQLGQFMGQMAQAGVQWFPDAELEKFIREAARLPELTDDEMQLREMETKQGEIMRMAQQKLQAVQLDQQITEGIASTMQGHIAAEDGEHQLQMGPEGRQQMGMQEQQQQMQVTEAQTQQQLLHGDAAHQQKMKQSDDLHRQRLTQAQQQQKMRDDAAKKAAANKPKQKGDKK